MARQKYIVALPYLVAITKLGGRICLPKGTIFYGDQYASLSGVKTYSGSDAATYDLDRSDGYLEEVSFTIAAGASLSGAVYLNGRALLGVSNPAALEAGTVKYIVLVCSTEAGTYQQIKDKDGNAVYLLAADGASGYLDGIGQVVGWTWIKLQALNSSDVAVAQTAAVSGTLIVGKVLSN